MKHIISIIILATIAITTGCRTAGGKAESLHSVEQWKDGNLVSREIWRDRNGMGVRGLLASDKASQFTTTRTNFMGSAASTAVGEFSGKPEASSIKAVGEAGSGIITGAIKGVK